MSGMSEAAKRGRRNWSLEDKWRIVQAAPLPGNSVAEVARRRGVNSNLLFRWIRAAEAGQLGHRPIPLCFCRNPLWTSFRSVCLYEAMTKGLRRRYRSPLCGGRPGGEFSAAQIGVAGQRARQWTSALASSKVFAFALTPSLMRKHCGVFLQRWARSPPW
ncbi:transposase [Sinorhizobium meliloti]|nr:transposase [Sinorhizobium meliloti]MDW9605096.1 transposase [Sinorhizobium meliloti]MDW9675195.1 transposase [Sinorhizobium meliloti]MDW9722563.1 transposase [Sinorhizobium meliloti]MDW9730779.1 transposase [Sinorhizobium meliloti]